MLTPLQYTSSMPDTKRVTSIRNAARFKQTVLLIDDQPTVLDIHAAILGSLKANLNIVSMTNPEDALAWMKNKQVDLIITDYRMQPMDGISFIKTIKQHNHHSHTSVVVVTIIKDKAVLQALTEAGVSACLTKPVKPEELKKLAQSLLDKNKQLTSTTT